MAEAAVVSGVLSKLAEVAAGKSVSEQIEQLRNELRLIQALLRDADSNRNTNELVTEWLNQVREIGNSINSVIDTFQNKIEGNHAESSNWVRNITKAVERNYKTYNYKHGLHKELEDITGKLNRIWQRGIELGIQDGLDALDDVDDPEPSHMVDDPEPSNLVDDPEVVGFEDYRGKIIEQLLNSSISRRTVLSIVGAGGLGKTTLAQILYNSAELEGQFNCRAWLSISQKYNLNDIWREILFSIEPQMKNQAIRDRDLPMMLKSSLRCKRYFIILDDVWDIDLWEQLEIAIPDPDNASRVIITTRSLDVAKAADGNTEIYEIDYLNDDVSLALLFRNAFQRHIQPENYPPHLLEIAQRLTKKCGGLPLALVVLGGILTRKDRNYTAWNKVEETMDWQDRDGQKCLKILARSYEALPHHLKLCFLYFAAFPKDYNISGRHVVRMWMAEEFIPKDGAGTIEDRAEKCLAELVQRCLIKVTKKSWNGAYCKFCNVPDLLWYLAITKAKEENFFTVFSKNDVNNLATSKPRRATLQFCTVTEDGVYSENTRSLLCFGLGMNSPNDCGFSKLNYSGFTLLRVLTLEHVDMRNFTQPQWPKGVMRHLRYLGLRDCHNPQPIFKKFSFNNLETIDLEGSSATNSTDKEIIDLSDVVVPTLRHVYGSWSVPIILKWDQHKNLQTIKKVWIQIELVAELGCCFNLRTLVFDIMGDMDNEKALKIWENLKAVLRTTEQLVHLKIFMGDRLLPFGGTTYLPCHKKIQKLYLSGVWIGDICVPIREMFPTNLIKLVLTYSRLEEDPMSILEKLPSLRILHLNCFSYVGTNLICSTGGFPNLENLQLSILPNICHWEIKKGAMPILNHLRIELCEELHTLPELQMVRTLQKLLVMYPSPELCESMRGDKDLYKIEHIPSVSVEERFVSLNG